MSGRQVIGEGQYLPIIAITGFPGEDDMQKCLDAGINDFIAKPFTAGQLFAKVWKQLRSGSNRKMDTDRERNRTAANTSVLAGEIFNEDDALKKSCGDPLQMVERIKTFLQTGSQSFAMLRENILSEKKNLLEQEIHRFNERAMEIGATNVADELFSMLMNLRNNQAVKVDQLEIVESEFENFRHEPKIQTLLGEGKCQDKEMPN